MTDLNINFNIVEKKTNFYIEEPQLLQKAKSLSFFNRIKLINKNYKSAIENLKKIEEIIEKIKTGKLSYDKTHQDKYSGLNQTDLIQRLKETANQIDESYVETTSKLNWFVKLIFNISSKQKQVHETQKEIEYFLEAPEGLFPYRDLMYVLGKYLSPEDLAKTERLNRRSQQQVRQTKQGVIPFARELGYGGDEKKLKGFFKSVLADIRNFRHENNIFAKKINASKKSPSEILETIKDWSLKETLELFANPDLYAHYDLINYLIHLAKRKSAPDSKINPVLLKRGLELAFNNHNTTVINFLLNQGADPNGPITASQMFVYEEYPLHWAVENNWSSVVESLLKYGAKTNLKGKWQELPLLFYSYKYPHFSFEKRFHILKLLLEKGADPTILHNGTSILHQAALDGSVEEIELLLNAGAKVDHLNSKGRSPLAIACGAAKGEYPQGFRYKPNVAVVKLLLERGADVNARDASGLAPLDYARNNGLYEIANLLKS